MPQRPLAQFAAGPWPPHPSPPNGFGRNRDRFEPASLPLPDALHRAPTRVRTEVLQRTSPRSRDSLVAARPVTRTVEKNVR